MHISGTTPIATAQANSAPEAAKQPEMEKAARAFEAIFLRQMIGAMRSSSLSEGVFDSSVTEQFRDMADAKTAEEMSKTGSFGIAELLMRQFAPKTPLTPAVSPAMKATETGLPIKDAE